MARTKTSTTIERRPPAAAGSAGFTLLELMVVIAVAALAAALVIPRLTTPSAATDAARASRLIAAALRETRDQAIFANDRTAFILDVERRAFRAGNRPAAALPTSVDISLGTAESLVTDDGKGEILFYPDGSSTGGQILVEPATRSGGDAYEVRVDWLTGRIEFAGHAN